MQPNQPGRTAEPDALLLIAGKGMEERGEGNGIRKRRRTGKITRQQGKLVRVHGKRGMRKVFRTKTVGEE